MKTLDAALNILKLFLAEQHTFSVGEVAAATHMQKSKVSRLLAVYKAHGVLDQDPVTRRYRVGLSAFELGSQYVKSHPIAHEALPIMREVVDACGHSTTLTVMHGDIVLHLMAVEGPLYTEGRWRVGNRLPFHATSAGKVLVAGLDAAELDAFVASHALTAITPQTVTNSAVLKRQLIKVRRTGSCISRGESAPGLAAIAVPVFGRQGETIAALGLVIPDHLFEAGKAASWTELLHRGARRLSMRLGASAYPFGGGPEERATTRKKTASRAHAAA